MITEKDTIKISFNEDQLVLTFNDITVILQLAQISKKLLEATPTQRQLYMISPSGYGIHWPLIDEDLAINKLLE